MSRSGRSQPIQPFSAHGFVDPGPGPVGTVPPRATVVENDDRRRRTPPPRSVVISGGFAVVLPQAAGPPAPTVVPVPERPRTSATASASHWFVDSGVGVPGTAPPAPVNVDRVDQRVRFKPLDPVSLNGLLASFVAVPPGTPPAPVNVDRADQRARYRPLDPVTLNGLLASLAGAAPAPTPPGPFVVPLDERRRFLAALPPSTSTHGFDDAVPLPADVFEPEDRRRRVRPLDPISISGALAPFLQPFVRPPASLVVISEGKRRLVPQPFVLSGPGFPVDVVLFTYLTGTFDPSSFTPQQTTPDVADFDPETHNADAPNATVNDFDPPNPR